jgi:hypothetical protein
MFLGIGLPVQRGSGGSGGYTTSGRDYDGTNDYATRGADLTGIADGQAGIVSLWFRLDGGDGIQQLLLANAATAGSSTFFVTRTAANVIQIGGRNTALTLILSNVSTGTYVAGASWVHLLASWDLAAGIGQLYINGADDKNGAGTQTLATIDYTMADFSVGAGIAGTNKLNGCLSEVFFHTQYLDISNASNRQLFRSAAGKPVSLGPTGALPLGVQPLLYAPNGDPSTNAGSGGNFTVTGALDAASTSPSD